MWYGTWYPGTVHEEMPDGSCRVIWDEDGTASTVLPGDICLVQVPPPPTCPPPTRQETPAPPPPPPWPPPPLPDSSVDLSVPPPLPGHLYSADGKQRPSEARNDGVQGNSHGSDTGGSGGLPWWASGADGDASSVADAAVLRSRTHGDKEADTGGSGRPCRTVSSGDSDEEADSGAPGEWREVQVANLPQGTGKAEFLKACAQTGIAPDPRFVIVECQPSDAVSEQTAAGDGAGNAKCFIRAVKLRLCDYRKLRVRGDGNNNNSGARCGPKVEVLVRGERVIFLSPQLTPRDAAPPQSVRNPAQDVSSAVASPALPEHAVRWPPGHPGKSAGVAMKPRRTWSSTPLTEDCSTETCAEPKTDAEHRQAWSLAPSTEGLCHDNSRIRAPEAPPLPHSLIG
eukprot:gnl/TRDRNA2_/TRDRNA2_138734_c0_seq2.p1 gnl/TRDRNA2_/TRDRNA2_138734_c0~~gnl/TRDRNA2_/TRDRNA2_138734_c0_seq2.p1  ORF type:complete len:463 (+),score=63.06 gnl/TRDRNA2_/TRDRNA2_138734_c0_seq2:196-1389(+)